MRILITGPTGFIGTHLVCALREERCHDIMLLVEKGSGSIREGRGPISVVRGDLNEPGSYEESVQVFSPEVVIHLAWEGLPDYSHSMSVKNLISSARFVDCVCSLDSCRTIMSTGSCFEYGRKTGACRESDSVVQDSFFTWAKNAVYTYAALKCAEKHISLIWFRLFYVYGPGQRSNSLIPALVRAFRQKVNPEISSPFNANDFIYVGDVVEGLKRSIGTSVESGIYNLGSGRATTVAEVCSCVEMLVSGSNEFAKSLRLGQDTASGRVFWADMEKTERELGWRPQTPLLEGIGVTIESGI